MNKTKIRKEEVERIIQSVRYHIEILSTMPEADNRNTEQWIAEHLTVPALLSVIEGKAGALEGEKRDRILQRLTNDLAANIAFGDLEGLTTLMKSGRQKRGRRTEHEGADMEALLQVRVPTQLKDALQKQANERKQPMSWLVREVLQRGLESH